MFRRQSRTLLSCQNVLFFQVLKKKESILEKHMKSNYKINLVAQTLTECMIQSFCCTISPLQKTVVLF